MLKNPYENEGGLKAGQLLLSYPSIESYVISGFVQKTDTLPMKLGQDAKKYIASNRNIQLNKLSEDIVIQAAKEFIAFLEEENIVWNIDEFENASFEIYNIQEYCYMEKNTFALFSMLTLAFLQMGIIEI